MKEFRNYDNRYELRNYIDTTLIPFIYENLVDSYGIDKNDYKGHASDDAWEVIDGLYEVIYNYPARKVAEAYDYDPFSSISEMTGERFNSWNEICFEIIYNKFNEKYSDQLEF